MDHTKRMNQPIDILLVSDSEDLASAFSEQFSQTGDFRILIKNELNFSHEEVHPAFVICGILSVNSHLLGPVNSLKVKLPASPFIVIHESAADFEFSGVKIAAPFRISHLLSVLYGKLKVIELPQKGWQFFGCEYNPAEKSLTDAVGVVHRLTEKEAAILTYLYEANGQPVARELLLRDLWGYNTAAETHTVETHIYRLRQKIEKDAGRSRVIITDSLGYRLIR
jgi:hypothetical protein